MKNIIIIIVAILFIANIIENVIFSVSEEDVEELQNGRMGDYVEVRKILRAASSGFIDRQSAEKRIREIINRKPSKEERLILEFINIVKFENYAYIIKNGLENDKFAKNHIASIIFDEYISHEQIKNYRYALEQILNTKREYTLRDTYSGGNFSELPRYNGVHALFIAHNVLHPNSFFDIITISSKTANSHKNIKDFLKSTNDLNANFSGFLVNGKSIDINYNDEFFSIIASQANKIQIILVNIDNTNKYFINLRA